MSHSKENTRKTSNGHCLRLSVLTEHRQGPITPSEKHEALKVWIKNCQNRHYSKEIANLKSPSSTRLPLVRQLRLYLDTEGYLRCGGRIHNAPLSELTVFRT